MKRDLNPYGFPPHSVTCVVEGETKTKLAETILYHKGIGCCHERGSTEIVVVDQNEYVNRVRLLTEVYSGSY